ncbi:MAG: HlyD family efflux transporter periplasmic adaptor subunit [Planctomycetia bacterium]|nr:HlyD family efflux transporter periplasmic adaptor subunit [Planctomycetia bacterium]
MESAQLLEPETADATRIKIREAMAEMALLAYADTDRKSFFEQFIARVVDALAAPGGAVWLLSDEGRDLQLQSTTTLPADLPQDAIGERGHRQMLRQVLDNGNSAVVTPELTAQEIDEVNNPTPYLLLLVPLKTARRPHGIIEVFQRRGGDVELQRGYLWLIGQMAELAGEFLQNQDVRLLEERDSQRDRFDRFSEAVHSSIDVTHTAYTLANEARGLIECDRVSVIVWRRGRTRVAAISGQAVAESRANVVRLLLALAKRVIKSRQPLWYSGDPMQLPPQIEEPLHAYIDETHTQSLAVIPLLRPIGADADARADSDMDGDSEESSREPEVLGVLVIEQIKQQGLSYQTRIVTEQVTRRGAAALANAIDHDRVFLMPLWRLLAKTRWFVTARRLPKTIAAAAIVVAVGVGLCVIPADFRIAAQGTMLPTERRDVFVQENGVVSDVLVNHADQVKAGAELIRLRNQELEVQLAEVTGRQNSMQEQLRAVRWMEGNNRLSQEEKIRLSGQFAQLQKTHDSLVAQLNLLLAKQKQLSVRSPIDGQITTWDVKKRLLDRPVEKGQILLSVANPKSSWELELMVPENHAGFVADAWEATPAAKRNLKVGYILATDPGRRRSGSVTEVQHSAEVRGENGNTVMVRVRIDPADLNATQLRPGSAVTAQIYCGRRSIGYVWFHDIVAFVRSKILFRV